MPISGRKPLQSYSDMDENVRASQSSPLSDSRGKQVESRCVGGRSVSPNKSSPRTALYPDLSEVSKQYDPFYPKHIPSVYPELDRDDEVYEEINYETAIYSVEEDRGARGDSVAVKPAVAPSPPPRNRKGLTKTDSVDRAPSVPADVEEIRDGRQILDSPVLLFTIVGFTLAAALIAVFHRGIIMVFQDMNSMTEEEVALEQFHRNFRTFREDFRSEIHPDSMDVLQNALEHHVQLQTDKKNTYPTCVLVAGDVGGTSTLNCLADRIAAMVPTKDVSPEKNVHTVDLLDKSHEHDKTHPDEEDTRSRVHHGINEGLKEGAKIILFRNLEALVPKDIPLLQLFYSYCDGDNPTFPKTLWILTMGTKNVTFLESEGIDISSVHEEPGFARNASKKVEQFLESILPEGAENLVKKVEKGLNPLLTRIANYIVPVLRVSDPAERCASTKLPVK